LEEWLSFICELANELIESCKTSIQHQDLFHTGG